MVAVALAASPLRLVRLLFRSIQDGGNPLDVPAHDDRSETRQEFLVHGSSSAIAGLRLKLADVVPEALQAFLVARSARVPYHVFLLNRSACNRGRLLRHSFERGVPAHRTGKGIGIAKHGPDPH